MTTIRYYIHFIEGDGEASMIDFGFYNRNEAEAYARESIGYRLIWTVQSQEELNRVPVDKRVLRSVLSRIEAEVTQQLPRN